MTATAAPTTGTVRVGRWEYPAELTTGADGFPHVRRNLKRDGSGDWETAATKVADTFAAEQTAPAAIPGFVDEAPVNHDREDLRTANRVIFANFAANLDDVATAVDTNPGRAKAIVNELVQLGLVVQENVNGEEIVWQSAETYDHIDEDANDAKFEETVPADIKIRAVSTHGGKIGAQTKKPGKSDWKVGSNCPQGHLLEEGDVYVQPSGRKQCRKCRGGYASNS